MFPCKVGDKICSCNMRRRTRHTGGVKMKHKAERVDNLMYNGCEAHWHCTRCDVYVPFHCYTREQFENMECKGEKKKNVNTNTE